MSSISINDYIERLDEIPKKNVLRFIEFMKLEFPEVIPRICYSIPMWCVGEKMRDGYVGVSAAKEHFSIHLHDESYILKLKHTLPRCKFGKRCINIKYDDNDTITIVEQMIKQYVSSIL